MSPNRWPRPSPTPRPTGSSAPLTGGGSRHFESPASAGPGSDLRGSAAPGGLRGGLVAQLAAQDLPARGLGQLVDELDLPRVLVRGHALLAVGDERLLVDAFTGDERHVGLDGLAAVGVGDADDGRLADGLVPVQDVLDLARPDLVARGHDHVLLAVDEVEPAVLVHETHVAGVQRTA